MSLQQQQIQRQQQRQRNAPGDKAARTLASAEQHTVTNQSVQQVTENCGEDEDLKLTLIECKPTELAMDTLPCSSYPMYAYRPRGSSNSSQTTLTTSLGKLSLNEGNSCCRSELNVVATDNTKTSNGDCEEHSKFEVVVTTNSVTNKAVDSRNNISSYGKRKQECVEPRSRKGLVTITSKFKSAPRAPTIGVLAKKLRCLPLTGNTKNIFTPQNKVQQEHGNEDVHEAPINRLSSHVSIDSAKSTISNSSLKDQDAAEFTGTELAHYMGELNQQRMVH